MRTDQNKYKFEGGLLSRSTMETTLHMCINMASRNGTLIISRFSSPALLNMIKGCDRVERHGSFCCCHRHLSHQPAPSRRGLISCRLWVPFMVLVAASSVGAAMIT